VKSRRKKLKRAMSLRKKRPKKSRKTQLPQYQSSNKVLTPKERSREGKSSMLIIDRESAAEAEASKVEFVRTVKTRGRKILQRMTIVNTRRKRVRKSIRMRAQIVNAKDQDLESVFIFLICYKISIIERIQLLTCQQPFSSRSCA
jgi:hypothetical protein